MYKHGYIDTLSQFGLLEKQALLGRILGILKYPYGKERERAVRYVMAKNVAPHAARLADWGARGLNTTVTVATAGRVPETLSPQLRERIMRFVARHPSTAVGAPVGLAVPIPGTMETGMISAGALSSGLKRVFRIPTKEKITFRELNRMAREQGYRNLKDQLFRTGRKKTPAEFVPEAQRVLRDLAFAPRGLV